MDIEIYHSLSKLVSTNVEICLGTMVVDHGIDSMMKVVLSERSPNGPNEDDAASAPAAAAAPGAQASPSASASLSSVAFSLEDRNILIGVVPDIAVDKVRGLVEMSNTIYHSYFKLVTKHQGRRHALVDCKHKETSGGASSQLNFGIACLSFSTVQLGTAVVGLHKVATPAFCCQMRSM